MRSKKPHQAASFHETYLEAVRGQTEPAQVLTGIIVGKITAQGIDGEKHFDAIKLAITNALRYSSPAELENFEIDLKNISDELDIPIEIDKADMDGAAKAIAETIEQSSHKMFAALSGDALKSIHDAPAERLLHIENESHAFVRRLELTWAEAFKLLDIHIALCGEISEVRNHWLRKNRRRSKDLIVVDVVTRLHGRALMVAGETMVLLRNGFADGALSRWRTMHELAVTAMFVVDHGIKVAERYAEHANIDSAKAARQYQNFASLLGYRPLPQKERQRLDALVEELTKRYGKSFLGDYGWAAEALGNPNPKFSSIEAAVKLDKFRPYVRLASNTVHAGAKGTFFRVGIIGNQNGILAGASNAGLGEAGRLVALSLAQITVALLLFHPNTDSIVWSRVLLDLAEKVEVAFLKIQRRMEREEQRLNSDGN